MAGFGNFINLIWDNNNPPAINEDNLQAAWDIIKEVDTELQRSQTINSNDLLNYFFNSNCKEVDNFTDQAEYTPWASTTLSNDTVNTCIGNNSIKTLESDNTAGFVGMHKTIASINLALFNSSAASSTDDIILCVFYISNVAKVTNVTFKLGDDNSNNYNITYAAASCSTGWNIKRPHKSDFATDGVPTGWDDITWVCFQWYSTATAQNAYISFQYCGLCREDSDYADYYNPFQKYYGTVSGWENVFPIGMDYFVLYHDEAINKLGFIKVNPSSSLDDLYVNSLGYTNFISKWELYCKKAGYTNSILWLVDSDNYAEIYINNNILYLAVNEAGSLTTTNTALTSNLLKNERIEIYFEKHNDSIKVILKRNTEYLKIISFETVIAATDIGFIHIGAQDSSSYAIITNFSISHTAGHNLPENRIIFIKKQVTETVNNSTVIQNDDEFKLYLADNSIYEIELKLAVSGAANADFKCDWEVEGGCSQLTTRACIGPSIATADNTSTVMRSSGHNLTTDVSYGCDGSTAAYISEKFLVQTIEAGTLQFRWAQNTAQVSDTTISNSSYLKATKLN
jgi:hypothetical protein